MEQPKPATKNEQQGCRVIDSANQTWTAIRLPDGTYQTIFDSRWLGAGLIPVSRVA